MNYFLFIYFMLDLFMFMIMIFPCYYHKFHPLFMSLLLMFYSLFLVIKLNYMNSNYWYSYILFLLMIGGVMILILYLTSISNNEMFAMNLNYMLMFLIKFIIVSVFFCSMIFIGGKNLMVFSLMKDLIYLNFCNFNDLLFIKNLFLNIYISIYMLMYMFILMLVSVLICMKNLSPLRQMKF